MKNHSEVLSMIDDFTMFQWSTDDVAETMYNEGYEDAIEDANLTDSEIEAIANEYVDEIIKVPIGQGLIKKGLIDAVKYGLKYKK